MNDNTLFLRLEGPLQAWGGHESKFVIRRTCEAPTKSGVIGLLCAALGVGRDEAPREWLPQLRDLRMAVRIDRPGVRWWDYHTVGAKMDMRIAEGPGKTKPGAMLTRREYLCDASFLVALHGDPDLTATLRSAVACPKWTLYLGRKSCPPSRPLLDAEGATGTFDDSLAALVSVPWRKRLRSDQHPEPLSVYADWRPSPEQPEAPDDAEVWFDVPLTFSPPSHGPRYVIRHSLAVGKGGAIHIAEEPAQRPALAPVRPRADYTNSGYRNARQKRLELDNHQCVFCKSPATTVQHITYERAGGDESKEDLRALCRLCHDAVTMIEYGEGMGMDRINPEEERWRSRIDEKRREIIAFRSLETRRRGFAGEENE